MKLKKIFLALFIFPLFAGVSIAEAAHTITITPFVNETNDPGLEIIIESTHNRLCRLLRIVTDAIVQQYDVAIERNDIESFLEQNNIDSLFQGGIREKDDGELVLRMVLYRNGHSDFGTEIEEVIADTENANEAVGRILKKALRIVYDERGVGTLRVDVPVLARYFELVVNDVPVSLFDGPITALPAGTYSVVLYQERLFSKHPVFESIVEVSADEVMTLSFEIPDLLPEESDFFHSLDRDIICFWNKPEKRNRLENAFRKAIEYSERLEKLTGKVDLANRYYEWRGLYISSTVGVGGNDLVLPLNEGPPVLDGMTNQSTPFAEKNSETDTYFSDTLGLFSASCKKLQ